MQVMDQCCCNSHDHEWCFEPIFLQIIALADPINDGKCPGRMKRRQHAVPRAFVQIYCLTRCCQKRKRHTGLVALVGGNGDQKRALGHGHKGL